ncbi:MAG: Transport permease protein [Marmoricola sp.]|nr:Transport permease protein [Marmoricola sp.]
MATSLAPRMADYWWTVYRRTWKGSVVTSFVTPLLYVVAMGVLLGGFIKGDPAKLEGATSYLGFVVPGMLAAQSMQLAFGELTYPVMSGIKWHKTYFAMIATPLSVRDVVQSQVGFVLVRVAMTSAVFCLVVSPFGVFHSVGGALLAFLTQLLVGAAFATPVFALSSYLKDEMGFSLVFRLGMMPMFLFSGAFFPVANLGPVLQRVAEATPLWHGVDLTRRLTTGHVELLPVLGHLAYLGVLSVVGYVLTVRFLSRRLSS